MHGVCVYINLQYSLIYCDIKNNRYSATVQYVITSIYKLYHTHRWRKRGGTGGIYPHKFSVGGGGGGVVPHKCF